MVATETDPLIKMETQPQEDGKADAGSSSRRLATSISDEPEEIFASIRVLAPRPRTLHDSVSPFRDTGSFWDDLKQFTPGSMPHSAVLGITIGCMCGVLAFVYYTILEWLLEFLWRTVPEFYLMEYVPVEYHWMWIPTLGLTMALGVGLSVRYLGEPGDLSYTVQCVHDKAYIDMNHVLPMVAASQFSILGGGSLGPEAPLVAICAAFAGFVSRKVFGQTQTNLIRKHTLMGMASALAAFFGVPLGGSLFALEINNRFGIEYYEHTMEAIFAGTVCLCVFRGLAGMSMGPIWVIQETALPDATYDTVLLGGLLGLIGAGVAACFASFHGLVMSFFRSWNLLDNANAVLRALVGASVILTIGVFIPRTLFWGEQEFQVLATGAPAEDLPHVYPQLGLIGLQMNSFGTAMAVGIFKMIAISFTVAGGYRGGFIFPFFAAGAAFGKGLTYVFPTLPPSLATLSIAAGINVAITRTGLASPLILCALAGEPNAISPVLFASMVSLFATTYMPFIRSQVHRADVSHLATPDICSRPTKANGSTANTKA